MERLLAIILLLLPFLASASWFGLGSDEKSLPRLSELMEPATTNIDAAADFAAEGKLREAQECYRAAIAALDKIERTYPERAATPEFATVRNKRAYINAALDAMMLVEARENAKAVAVTDTTELEQRLKGKKSKKGTAAKKAHETKSPTDRKSRLRQASECLYAGDTVSAKAHVTALLAEKPDDGPALNLRAAIEAAEGDLRAAEKTLDLAIRSCPRDYHAYYNMAHVYCERDRVSVARKYYEMGRALSGPENAELEKRLKK